MHPFASDEEVQAARARQRDGTASKLDIHLLTLDDNARRIAKERYDARKREAAQRSEAAERRTAAKQGSETDEAGQREREERRAREAALLRSVVKANRKLRRQSVTVPNPPGTKRRRAELRGAASRAAGRTRPRSADAEVNIVVTGGLPTLGRQR